MTHQIPLVKHETVFDKTFSSWRLVALVLGVTVSAIALWAAVLNPSGSVSEGVPDAFAVQIQTTEPSSIDEFAALFQPREPIPAVLGSNRATNSAPVEPVIPSGDTELPPVTNELHPTPSWVNVFSPESTLDGQPLSVGDVITAFDVQGVLIGKTEVEVEGKYGLMALYMDDPLTAIDEGANPGEAISFEINDIPALVVGPHEPVWRSNGDVLMLNLAAIGPGDAS